MLNINLLSGRQSDQTAFCQANISSLLNNDLLYKADRIILYPELIHAGILYMNLHIGIAGIDHTHYSALKVNYFNNNTPVILCRQTDRELSIGRVWIDKSEVIFTTSQPSGC